MNKREEERLNALLAKKEAEEKADKEFFKKCKKRRDEVLKVLNAAAPKVETPNFYEERVNEIAQKYGCTAKELLDYIETERQISYYKKYGKG